MVSVDEGIFKMGGSSSVNMNIPVHEVVMPRFYLDKTEVTVDAYNACVTAGKCKPMKETNPFCNAKFKDRGKHPANCVDWNQAVEFCTFAGKRLPTEREWEYAARGGSKQWLYAWGNEEPDTKRSCYMNVGGSCEVGTHPAGGFGLFDMTGNVWEWTSSWYTPYPDEGTEGRHKVYRGGSWSRRFSKWMKNDLRNWYRVDEDSASLGIRCAKTITPTVCPPDTQAKDGFCLKAGQSAPVAVASAAAPAASGTTPKPHGTLAAVAGSAAPAASSAVSPEKQTPVRGRSPNFDADCEKHYPGKPVAYRWSGGSFEAREPLIKGAGCAKRDIGVGWTSACCAQ